MNYPNNVLVEFVKERRNGRDAFVGTFVGIKDRNVIRTGWSRCRSNVDVFSKEIGVAFACQNILMSKSAPVPVGRSFAKKYAIFQERCKRYFKDALNGISVDELGTRKKDRKIDDAADALGLALFSILAGSPVSNIFAPLSVNKPVTTTTGKPIVDTAKPVPPVTPVPPVQQEKVEVPKRRVAKSTQNACDVCPDNKDCPIRK